MRNANDYVPDAKLDLMLERVIDLTPEKVWAAWTTPNLVMQWFSPRPWETIACEIDLRPGGHFRTVMRSPEGQEFPNTGCYLEVVKNEKLVWTDALQPGFRPNTGGFMTAMILLEPHPKGCRYRAIALHKDEEGQRQHAEMGFETGWGMALDQMVELMR